MKRLLVSASLAIFCILAANAQCENPCPAKPCERTSPKCRMEAPCGKTAENRVERMKKNLSLSDEQCSKLTKVFNDFDKESQALRDKHRDEMQKHRNDLDKKIEKILTAEQLKTYNEKREKADKRPCYRNRPAHHGKKCEFNKRQMKPGDCPGNPECCPVHQKCCEGKQPQCCPEK